MFIARWRPLAHKAIAAISCGWRLVIIIWCCWLLLLLLLLL